MKAYILIFVICSLVSCQDNQNNSSRRSTLDDTSARSEPTKDLDGYWILTDYIDSILKDKSIAKHSQYPISESMVSFKIQNDSMFSEGLIFNGFNDKISLVNDTLKQIRSSYTFYYNRKSDQIEATPKQLESGSYFHKKDKEKYIYRRVKEKRLIHLLAMGFNTLHEKSEDSFHQLFIDSLLVGEYKSIRNGKKLLLTGKNSPHSYSMSGLMRYNKYDIYDYLERVELDQENPFNSYDAIIFQEHRGEYSENDIPKWIKMGVYNWRFSGDTLTLIEMKDTIRPNSRFGEYFLGSKKFTFISARLR